MSDRERKPRGVRLGDLDRAQQYVLAYVPGHRRWEVVGLADRRMAVENAGPAHGSASSRGSGGIAPSASQLDAGEI